MLAAQAAAGDYSTKSRRRLNTNSFHAAVCAYSVRLANTTIHGVTAESNPDVDLQHAQDSGVPLASNQIQYSLLYRVPETNGVIEAVNEAGATVIAYSPLAQGLLTGAFWCGPCGQTGHWQVPRS